MRSVSRMMATVVAVLSIMVCSMTSALAATSTIDWNDSVVRVAGYGVAPANARTPSLARLMARRAAIADGYRQMAEAVAGVSVDADTTVEMAAVSNDVVRTHVSAVVNGARIVSERVVGDSYEVIMEVPMFGVRSIAGAVMGRPDRIEAFPSPVTSVAPSSVLTTGSAESSKGSSAASAPAGRAIGGFTGLIVDCRGLDIKPVMSPAIYNDNGQPIYGYKNLDYDKVVENGMAGYAKDMDQARRAGSNPLVVRAVSLMKHNSCPVLSTADANRVLIENGASHFLDKTNVVFLR